MAVTPADASWVLSAYLLAVSCLLALAGKAADALGRKRVYVTGCAFFVAGSATCAAAPSLGTLVGARVVQGVGAAMLMAVGPALVTRAVRPDKRARALGVQLSATYLGLTLGPGLGGLLAASVGWQAVFAVVAGAAATLGVAARVLLPPDSDGSPRERPRLESLDLGGAVLFAAGLAALLVALQRTREDGWTGRSVLLTGALGVILLATFARREAVHATPLVPLGLLRSPPFSLGVLGATLLYTITFVLAYALPFELQHASGLSAAKAGAFMTAQPATMAVVAPVSGVMADRWGPRLPSTAGMLAIAAGMTCLSTAGTSPNVGLVLALCLVGLGAGLYVAPNSASIMGAAPRDRQATAGAVAATARNVGMTLGIALGASLGHALGFRRTLLIAAGLAVAGSVLGVVRPAAHGAEHPQSTGGR